MCLKLVVVVVDKLFDDFCLSKCVA